jgi:hypothetical protein
VVVDISALVDRAGPERFSISQTRRLAQASGVAQHIFMQALSDIYRIMIPHGPDRKNHEIFLLRNESGLGFIGV